METRAEMAIGFLDLLMLLIRELVNEMDKQRFRSIKTSAFIIAI
jgi:hypothetical protein